MQEHWSRSCRASPPTRAIPTLGTSSTSGSSTSSRSSNSLKQRGTARDSDRPRRMLEPGGGGSLYNLSICNRLHVLSTPCTLRARIESCIGGAPTIGHSQQLSPSSASSTPSLAAFVPVESTASSRAAFERSLGLDSTFEHRGLRCSRARYGSSWPSLTLALTATAHQARPLQPRHATQLARIGSSGGSRLARPATTLELGASSRAGACELA